MAHVDDQRPPLPGEALVGVSAHDAQQVQCARSLAADFMVVGPVAETASHPGQAGIGWDAFIELNRDAGLPAYAIGGQSPATLALAQRHGAHGIAAIRALFGAA